MTHGKSESSPLVHQYSRNSRASFYTAEEGRGSIFSDTGIEDFTKTLGSPRIAFLKQHGLVYLIEFLIFISVVILGGLHPLIYEAALYNPHTHMKNPEFNPHTVYMTSFFGLFLFSTIAAGVSHGPSFVTKCVHPVPILLLFPLAAIFCTAETIDIFSLARLDAGTKMTLGQVKLPFTALISVLVLRQYMSPLEWFQILGATFSIFGYCSYKNKDIETRIDPVGIGLVFLNVLICTFGCIATEVVFKTREERFFVRLSQMRFGAFLTSTCYFLCHILHNSLWGVPFFHGWNRWVIILVVWTSAKDCLIQALIKRLNNVWRTLAGSLSLGLSYFASSILHRQRLDLVLSLFVVVLVIHVIALSLVKREHRKRLELLQEYAAS